MHVPRDINPFVLTEPVESLNHFKLSLASCWHHGTWGPYHLYVSSITCWWSGTRRPFHTYFFSITWCLLGIVFIPAPPSPPPNSALPTLLVSQNDPFLLVPYIPNRKLLQQKHYFSHSLVLLITWNMLLTKLSTFPLEGITLTNAYPLDNWLINFQALIKSWKFQNQVTQ